MRRFAAVLLLLVSLTSTDGTRLAGTFSYYDVKAGESIVFLAKFGVKKGQPLSMYGSSEVIDYTYNYQYNYTSVYLAFMPSEKWNSIKKAADKDYLDDATCNDTFYQLFDSPCPSHVTEGHAYIRTMPCLGVFDPGLGGVCYQPQLVPAPEYNDFLYHYDEIQLTEFWYAFFILCSQNRSIAQTCDWKKTDPIEFKYNYSIISNGEYQHPDQVPANYQGLLPFYSVFSGLYILLISVHFTLNSPLCKKKEQRIHLLVWLYTLAMILEALNIICGLIHYAIFTHDGMGVPVLLYIKDALNIVSDWFLIVILVLVAGGWQVTLRSVKWKCASFWFCAFYIVFATGYFVGDVVSRG